LCSHKESQSYLFLEKNVPHLQQEKEKMQNKKFATILLAAVLFISIAAATAPANAQKSGEMQSFAYLIVEPNPVGIGQTTYIAMMVDVPLPGSSEANDIRRHNYKLTITAPDGKVTTQSWAVVPDTTGV